ncbi:MAG: hypothetical protein HOP29_14120 [Phycisphaerales bacterium]|nr:hypothetical protein [Phycisphaerales bacterium]
MDELWGIDDPNERRRLEKRALSRGFGFPRALKIAGIMLGAGLAFGIFGMVMKRLTGVKLNPIGAALAGAIIATIFVTLNRTAE